MKNLPLGLSIVSLVAVAILYIMQFSGKKGAEGAPDKTTAAGLAETVYVNTDSILAYYDYFTDMKADLDSKQNKAKATLEGRAKTFQQKVSSFQARAQAQLVSQNDFNRIQGELTNEENELRNYEQALTNGLYAETQEINNKAYDNIIGYLKEWNKDKNYKFVVTYVKGGNILLADEKLEITQEVLAGINKKYKEEKSAAASTTPAAGEQPKK